MNKSIVERQTQGWQHLPESWPECLRKVFAARGIQSELDLRFSLEALPRPQQMLGMDLAVALLEQALLNQWRVMIVADFDSDGATSCALAIRGLKAMGLQHISYVVPNRFIHGYGLTKELLDEVDETEQPDLIVTVDNGIAAHSGIDSAIERGIKVLVTDHHLASETLPHADAIINPNQKNDQFPSKNLAGVGVCFYLLLGLRQQLRDKNWFQQKNIIEPKVIEWLDLVALGTVADVVPLDKLNRTLVEIGLNRIRQGQCCAGIKALAQVSGKQLSKLISTDLGFSIAPRLNAAGRMEDMRVGIDLLIETNEYQALKTATWLDQVNLERRAVEKKMQDEAILMLDALLVDTHEKDYGYCLYDREWHQGVIGLLASRLKDKLNRPVIIFAPGNEGELKGSARSIKGIHIRDVLAYMSMQEPTLLQRFGGHAMAAGMTIKTTDLPAFQSLFDKTLRELVEPKLFHQALLSDGEVTQQEMSLTVAKQLNSAAPWGQSFEQPCFHGVFTVEYWKTLGHDQSHLKLQLAYNSLTSIKAIAFRQPKPEWLQQGSRILLRFRLDVNEFRGVESLQLVVEDLFQV